MDYIKNMKPILKWAGGKRAVLNHLLENIPKKYNTYYEPFLGSGTLFFALEPQNGVISDINFELINFYQTLASHPDKLIFHLGLYENTKEFYYKIRKLDRTPYYKVMNPVDKAARFLYLNKTCFNGLYRVNKKGEFNVPYGNYKNPNYRDIDHIKTISDYIAGNNISIRKGDYYHTTKDVSEGDFVYLDPPYYNSYDQYTSNRFNLSNKIDYINEQVKVRRLVDNLTNKNISVMISNSDENFIKEIYKEYNIKVICLTRSINPKSKKRKTTELLITNY